MRLKLVTSGIWRICAVATDRGDCQLLDFLHSQESAREGTVTGILNLLEYIAARPEGPRDLSDKQSHQIGDGLWELIRGGIRICYFYDDNKLIICTHGFNKKSQKTPKREIEKVKHTKQEYFEQKKSGVEIDEN